MKTIKFIFLMAIIGVFAISCANTEAKKDNSNQNEEIVLPAKITNVEVKIEGMTCEIGCARLIQSKLMKAEGVNYADISFEQKKGRITFDANQINDSEIKILIENIAGGDLYKVIEVEKVIEFKEEESKATL